MRASSCVACRRSSRSKRCFLIGHYPFASSPLRAPRLRGTRRFHSFIGINIGLTFESPWKWPIGRTSVNSTLADSFSAAARSVRLFRVACFFQFADALFELADFLDADDACERFRRGGCLRPCDLSIGTRADYNLVLFAEGVGTATYRLRFDHQECARAERSGAYFENVVITNEERTLDMSAAARPNMSAAADRLTAVVSIIAAVDCEAK
jgi:hypothetical protein